MTLRQQLAQFTHLLQNGRFPILEQSMGQLSAPSQRLVAVSEMLALGRLLPPSRGWIGRPAKDRQALARAFVGKAVYLGSPLGTE